MRTPTYTDNIQNVTLKDLTVMQWPTVGQFDTLLPLFTLLPLGVTIVVDINVITIIITWGIINFASVVSNVRMGFFLHGILFVCCVYYVQYKVYTRHTIMFPSG
jgi:hypothetical protein